VERLTDLPAHIIASSGVSETHPACIPNCRSIDSIEMADGTCLLAFKTVFIVCRVFNKLRPNTAVDDAMLHTNILLCCGEDEAELLSALHSLGIGKPTAYHNYRCYRFWLFPQFALIWTGIGTGCLEPLLYEILCESAVEKICLVGTAGMSRPRQGLVKGVIYYLSEARAWASGVRPVDTKLLFRPNWSGSTALPAATILSTDYYYGLSRIDNPVLRKLRNLDSALAVDFVNILDTVDLVDMEVAQFYFLCSVFGKPGLEWCALKGPANSLEDFSDQMVISPRILENSARAAFSIMNIRV